MSGTVPQCIPYAFRKNIYIAFLKNIWIICLKVVPLQADYIQINHFAAAAIGLLAKADCRLSAVN